MYLYGASGHARVIIDILEKGGFEIQGLFDDNHAITSFMGYHCSRYDFREIQDEILISIGDNTLRKKIAMLIGDVIYGKAVDINSIVSTKATVDYGTVIMPGAVVNAGARVGKHVIINTNASVDHDCVLQDFVHVAPGSSVSGNVTIGEGTLIGIGSSIIQNVRIGEWSIVGAGSVIIRDVPAYSVIVGNPGRIIKTRKLEINEL